MQATLRFKPAKEFTTTAFQHGRFRNMTLSISSEN